MSKRTNNNFTTTFIYTGLFFAISLIIYSCSSRKQLMVEPLFRQSDRVAIDLPTDEFMIDSVTGAVIATETVVYKNEEKGEFYNLDSASVDDNRTADMTKNLHRLNAVAVKAKSRFAPEREGYITTVFTVRVPKELIAPNWSVVVEPVLMHNDSVVPLRKVVLRGTEFAKDQKEGYAKYREFLKTLVSKPEYKDHFLDKKKINKDIKKQQEYAFEQYYNRWSKRADFDEWKFERATLDAEKESKRMGDNYKEYSKYSVKSYMEADPEEREKGLPVGMSDKYKKEYSKKTKGYSALFHQKEMTEKEVPQLYRKTFEEGVAVKDIKNNYLAEEDIDKISGNRYYWDKMARNEAMVERRRGVFKKMVKHPYMNPQEVYADSIVGGDEDYVISYVHHYPVSEGLKNVRVTLNSQVRSIDQSTYRIAPTDTITYVVSSLSQLMDTTYATREAAIYNNVRGLATMYLEYADNGSKFDIAFGLNRPELEKFFSVYDKAVQEKLVVENVNLAGTISLEGNALANESKNAKRLENVRNYIVEKRPELKNVITVDNKGEDIKTAIEMISQSVFVQNKDKIADILRVATDLDSAELVIKDTYRADYAYISDFIYPKLRRVDVVMTMARDKNNSNQTVAQTMMADYARALELLDERRYTPALEILEQYSDYNTALTMACLGYNSRAYDVLRGLPSNADNEYLKAIVMYRLKNEKIAAEHLLKACELDHTKIYRAQQDSETRLLVAKYGLQKRLEEIENTYLKSHETVE